MKDLHIVPYMASKQDAIELVEKIYNIADEDKKDNKTQKDYIDGFKDGVEYIKNWKDK